MQRLLCFFNVMIAAWRLLRLSPDTFQKERRKREINYFSTIKM